VPPCLLAGCRRTPAAAHAPPLQRADEIAAEKNRALKAALNAELRKTKATLLEQAIPLLEKMAKKGKGLTPDKVASRQAQVRPALLPGCRASGRRVKHRLCKHSLWCSASSACCLVLMRQL